MRKSRLLMVAVLGLGLSTSAAVACLWDTDTIQMERARFPNTLELITGKFLRHSPEFYQWRIQDRLKKLEASPNSLPLLDDLAVAYDKTGQHDEAVKTAERADAMQPNRYETLANLGTFHIHAGRLQEGLVFIDRAIAINPDAHFGREIYQKKLVEYVLARRKDGATLPLANVVKIGPHRLSPSVDQVTVGRTFADFLRSIPGGRELTAEQLTAALKGVQGIMKFGNYDSPIVLEALASLLKEPADGKTLKDAALLASRAYLQCSYLVKDEAVSKQYRSMAAGVLALHMTSSTGKHDHLQVEEVESKFLNELAVAEAWYKHLREQELNWIRDGANVEAKFNKLYGDEPLLSGVVQERGYTPSLKTMLWIAGVIALGLLCLFVRIRSRVWRNLTSIQAGEDQHRV